MAHQAMLWERLAANDMRVRCKLCSHFCVVGDGKRGVCGVRENRDGVLYTLVYGRAIARHVDPIEKKPLFHFLPGSRAYSMATAGCNLHCTFCQNWEISQLPDRKSPIPGEPLSPSEAAQEARRMGCAVVAYTYTEPTVYAEYALDTAREAKALGLRNVFVSNGYMASGLLAEMAGLIDAINVDLKAGQADFYRKVSGAALAPVLANLKVLQRLGIWLEVTTLVIPGQNDSEDELRSVAEYLHGELGPDVPWHVSRFHPDYLMTGVPPTPAAALERAFRIGRDVGLRYIYVGNLPGLHMESTFCPGCGMPVVGRVGYRLGEVALQGGACRHCGTAIAGVWA